MQINQKIASERCASIYLRDIRELERVKKDPAIFSSEIPVYFRSDLLRLIIAEVIVQQEKMCCIYADLDVGPLAYKELFDAKTVKLLNKYGFVMAYENNKLKFENSFHIVNYNYRLLDAMRVMLIEANIERANNFLREAREEKLDNSSVLHDPVVWSLHHHAFKENVYYSYPVMWAYFCKSLNASDGVPTLPSCEKLKNNAKICMTDQIVHHLFRFPMPTKKVSIPASTSINNIFA